MKKKNVFITGINSGFGESLANIFSLNDYIVSGISKRKKNIPKNINFVNTDLEKLNLIEKKLKKIFTNNNKFEYIILNAGILGKIKLVKDIKVKELIKNLKINFFANKIIIDYILKKKINFKTLIAISSGAAFVPKHGWFNYSISKVSLRFLIESYAIENSKKHFINFNPGPINTSMQKEIRKINSKKIPSVKFFKDEFNNNNIKSADYVATLMFNKLDYISKIKSGNYVDLRKIV